MTLRIIHAREARRLLPMAEFDPEMGTPAVLMEGAGITAQDLYAAELVHRRALESGTGVEVDF